MNALHRLIQAGSTKLESARPVWQARVPPLPVTAAAAAGVIGGVALGAIVGPVGVALGIWLGVGVGIAAGQAITRDDAKQSARTRELDEIIGITRGTMGKGDIVFDDSDDDDVNEPAPESDRDAWAAEWLTPPPPAVG